MHEKMYPNKYLRNFTFFILFIYFLLILYLFYLLKKKENCVGGGGGVKDEYKSFFLALYNFFL